MPTYDYQKKIEDGRLAVGLSDNSPIDDSLFVGKMYDSPPICLNFVLFGNSPTVNYAGAVLAAIPADLLVDGTKPEMRGVTPEKMTRMESIL